MLRSMDNSSNRLVSLSSASSRAHHFVGGDICLLYDFTQILTIKCFSSSTYQSPRKLSIYSMAQQTTARKQQELQNQYSTFKNNLQQIAQKIGDVETEAEEHK